MPRRAGTAIFAGGGAWLPRAGVTRGDEAQPGVTRGEQVPPGGLRGDEAPPGHVRGDEALLLSEPCRILVATAPNEIPKLLDEVDVEQRRGRYIAGYLAYEAGAAFGLSVQPPAADALPLAWMGVYPRESATVVPASEWRARLDSVDVSLIQQALAETAPKLSVTRDEYVEAIRRVRELIAAGDTYQVNYTVRGRFDLAPAGAAAPGADAATAQTAREPAGAVAGAPPAGLDPLDYFLALVIRQPVPYAAYLDLGPEGDGAQVISLSPEMFLRRDGRVLESRPMKGTRPRGATHAEDVALAYELAETEKERAENLMIVDMVRNDLGRVCRAGSVRVPTLYAVEPYRTVWQMVSTVTGDVNPRASLAEIMRAVFPGASITGAPKHHTMEIIAALETEPREVYTGTVGCFYPGGDFTCNIAIRTIIHRQGHCKLGTGSGIVWDADPAAEYEETLVKAAFATPPRNDTWRPDPAGRLLAAASTAEKPLLFETMLLGPRDWDATVESPDGLPGLSSSLDMSDAAILDRYRFLEEHVARMARSAEALGYAFDREVLLSLLVGLGRIVPQAAVVRVDLDAHGGFNLSQRGAPGPGAAAGAAAAGAAAAVAAAAGAPDGPTAVIAPIPLLVSPFRTDPDDPFLQHKTSLRGFYNREHRRALHEECFDAVFLNRLDHVTEGAITNVFARFGGQWVTPPLSDGLLPGIWRGAFLAQTSAEERSLTLADLLAADEILAGNSVRGAVQAGRLIVDPLTF